MADSSNATTFPTNEPRLLLWDDRTNLEGLLLQGIVYGIHAVVFVGAMNGLLFSRRARSSALKTWLLALYTFFMFAIGTFMVGANTQVCISMFVDNRSFIAGPSAWIADNFSLTANTFGNIAYVLGLFAADALLLYRTFIVWNKNVCVMIGPGLLFLASSSSFSSFPPRPFWLIELSLHQSFHSWSYTSRCSPQHRSGPRFQPTCCSSRSVYLSPVSNRSCILVDLDTDRTLSKHYPHLIDHVPSLAHESLRQGCPW